MRRSRRNPEYTSFADFVSALHADAYGLMVRLHPDTDGFPLTVLVTSAVPMLRENALAHITNYTQSLLAPEYSEFKWEWSSPEHVTANVEASSTDRPPFIFKVMFNNWVEPIDLDRVSDALNRVLAPQYGVGVLRQDKDLILSQSGAPMKKQAFMEELIEALNALDMGHYAWAWKNRTSKRQASIMHQERRTHLFGVIFPNEWRQYSEHRTECGECGNETEELYETDNTHQMLCDQCAFECECGRWIGNDNSHVTSGDRRVCEECYDENYCTCERCDAVVECDDTQNVRDSTWCDRCYERHAWNCSSCDESFSDNEDSFTISPNDETICQRCYERGEYFTCDGCNQSYSDVHFGGSRGNGNYCSDCWSEDSESDEESEERPVSQTRPSGEDVIQDYHSHHRHWNRFGHAARGIYYGVELEAISAKGRWDFPEVAKHVEDKYGVREENGTRLEFLFTEFDGSLRERPSDPSSRQRGFETITHPMAPEFVAANVDLFKNLLADMIARHMVSYEATDQGISAGMHITLLWSQLSNWSRVKFLQLVYDNKNLTMVISRRFKESLEHYASITPPARIPRMVMKKEGYDAHFVAVNLKNCLDNKTGKRIELAEVRIFRGTLKLESFLMNLEYVMACVEFARDIRFGLKDTTDKNLLAYIREKRKLYPHIYSWLKEKSLV